MRRRFMNSHKTFDYSKYMTIEALEDGYEVRFIRDVEYNLNGHKWVLLKANLLSPTLKKGDLLSLRCSLMPGEIFGSFRGNDKAINLRGNILSLIFKDDIKLDISGYAAVFTGLFDFSEGSNIINVEKNFLPASTLEDSCYLSMFYNCKNLITAPELPATTLVDSCYHSMFYGCTSLTTAPELPATTLVERCYNMMFCGCEKLNYIKMLATHILATTLPLHRWVDGVSSIGTFVKNHAMTSLPMATSDNDYVGIPSGWTVVNGGEESGGGKIENYLRKGNTSITSQELTLDFPAETDLLVYYTTSYSGSLRSIFAKGHSTLSIGLGPGDSIVSVDRLYPNEDDVYIYKIDYK